MRPALNNRDRIAVFAKIYNFTIRNVDIFFKMVEICLRRVDYFLAVFFCLIGFSDRLPAQTGAEDYIVINRLSRENGLPDQDVNGI